MNADHSGLSRSESAVALVLIAVLAVLYGRLIYAPCDDAYIFFVYAKNFVEGHGPTFNGMRVWGFTSILWMGLLSWIGALGVPIHIGGEILSAISGAFALWTTYLLGRALSLRRAYALVPPLLLAVTGDFAFYSSVGLEQVLFVGMVAACAAATVPLGRHAPARRIAGVALLMALTILTRPEGGLICGLLLLAWAIRGRSLAAPFVCGIALTGLMVPVLIAMHAYYGDWVPNTYYAKSNAGIANLPQGIKYLMLSAIRYGPIGAFAAVLLVQVFRKAPPQHVQGPAFLLVIAGVWALYVTLQGGDNMVGGRFIIPVLPIVYVPLVCLLPPVPTRTLALGASGLCLVLLLSYAADPWVRRQGNAWRESYAVRHDAGVYLREHFPADTLVALGPAGIIPYYSGLPTIDMLGLNNRHIARFGIKDRSLRFAHQAGDGRYVLDQEPDVVLFGGSLAPRSSNTVSEREIWESARFHEDYVRVDWEGIGTAWVRKKDGPLPSEGRSEATP